MSILDYLEQLRKKPIHYRKRVAAISAAVITGVIVLIWLSTFNLGTGEIIDQKAVAEEFKPLEQIKESIADFYSSVKEMSSALFAVSTSSPAPAHK